MPVHHGKSGTSAGVPQGNQRSPGHPSQDSSTPKSPTRYGPTMREVAGEIKPPTTGDGEKQRGDGKPLIDIKKTGENIAVSQGLQYAGIDPISSMLIGPTFRYLKKLYQKKQPETYWERGDKSIQPPVTRGDGGPDRDPNRLQQTAGTTPVQPVKKLAMKPYYMGFDFQKGVASDDHSLHGHKHQLGVSGQKVPDPRKRTYQGWEFKKGGLSGGKRFGPPPKKGPNPHGKCPFRPDGIKGYGAVKPGRGVKFIGTK